MHVTDKKRIRANPKIYEVVQFAATELGLTDHEMTDRLLLIGLAVLGVAPIISESEPIEQSEIAEKICGFRVQPESTKPKRKFNRQPFRTVRAS